MKSIETIVRRAKRVDAEAIAALVIGFRDFLGRTEPSNQDIVMSVGRQLRSEDVELLVAVRDETLIGYATLLYRYSLWANGVDATISDLFVVDAERKSGAGRTLIESSLKAAQTRNCRSVSLSTNEMNAASTKIYEAVGFSSYSKIWNGRQVFYRMSIAPTDA